MLRALSVVLLLSAPSVAFADDPPPADAPTQAPLVPTGAEPAPQARWCNGTQVCGGGKAKFVVAAAVTGTVLTAVAIAIAAGVAKANATPAQTLMVR